MSYRKPFSAFQRSFSRPYRQIVGPSDHGAIVGPSDFRRLMGLGDAATPREAARLLYDQATDAYNAGNFVAAERLFREAYDTMPNAAVLVSIARTEEEQGNAYEAYLLYQRYLSQEPSGSAASLAREGLARTQPSKTVSTTAPVYSDKTAASPTIPASAMQPMTTEEVFDNDARGPSIAVWAVTGAGVLGLMGLGYWLTRPKKKMAANRRRRRK
jgi:hypothetical protein